MYYKFIATIKLKLIKIIWLPKFDIIYSISIVGFDNKRVGMFRYFPLKTYLK